jgi:hypothetical protein
MAHRSQNDSDAGIENWPQCGQPEPAPAAVRHEARLDHHMEELQAAFDRLARGTA